MLRLGLVLLIAPSVLLMLLYMQELNKITTCLQASGYFDYVTGLCDMHNKQPFVAFSVRHPLFVNFSLIFSIVGLVVSLIGLYKNDK